MKHYVNAHAPACSSGLVNALLKRAKMVLMLALISGANLYAMSNAKDHLILGARHFDKGQYEMALSVLKDVNIRKDLDSSDDMKLAFKIRAISYEQTGQIARAQETIRELLFLDPSYQFSLFDTPASVVALAQQEKDRIEEKNRRLAIIKTETKGQLQPEVTTPKIEAFENTAIIQMKPPLITTLFPVGLNHFYLNAPVKGGFYMSVQILGLGSNILAYWWKQSYLDRFGSNNLAHHSNREKFETAQIIQFVALGALIVGYTASVIDALISWQNLPSQAI